MTSDKKEKQKDKHDYNCYKRKEKALKLKRP